MTAPTTKLDGAMMTDEQIMELADQIMTWGKVCYVDADKRGIVAFARALLSASKPAAPQGWTLVPDHANADAIVSSLYRRFKDWSKRGFGPEDVTWCEVKADVLVLLAASPAAPATDTEEDAYVIKRLSTVLAKVAAALMDDDADGSATDVLAKLPEGAQTLKLEVELYRANAAAAPAQSGEAKDWRVGLFYSSSNPRKQVRVLADGHAQIAEYEKHHSFVRWIDAAAPQPAQTGEKS